MRTHVPALHIPLPLEALLAINGARCSPSDAERGKAVMATTRHTDKALSAQGLARIIWAATLPHLDVGVQEQRGLRVGAGARAQQERCTAVGHHAAHLSEPPQEQHDSAPRSHTQQAPDRGELTVSSRL